MMECISVEKIDQSFLTNPEQGRAYLKTALEQNNEQVFLRALHNIIDGFLDSELDLNYELAQFSALENNSAK